MEKQKILKLIRKECFKLEEKYSLPMDIHWNAILENNDEELELCVELAYNCIKKYIKYYNGKTRN